MSDAAPDLPLLCALGWHRARPFARWNNGYYFTKCARCDSDLVRAVDGRWQAPRGFRVVWQGRAPINSDEAVEICETEAELPAAEPEAPPPPPEPEVLAEPEPPRRRSHIPDFMDNSAPTQPPVYVHQAAAPPPPPTAPAEEAVPGFFARLRSGPPEPTASTPRGPGPAARLKSWSSRQLRGRRHLLLAAAVPVAVVLAVLALWGRFGADPAEANALRFPSVDSAAAQPAYVAASTLNCRSAPAMDAPAVATLMRGDRIGLLSSQGEWMSIAHDGGQCWALAQYLSIQAPPEPQ